MPISTKQKMSLLEQIDEIEESIFDPKEAHGSNVDRLANVYVARIEFR